MNDDRPTIDANRGRARSRRDPLLVAAGAVAIACLVVFALLSGGLRDLAKSRPLAADGTLGIALLLVVAACAFALLRDAAARRGLADRAEAERRYQALIEQVPTVTYTWDPARRADAAATLYMSPQIEHLLGDTAEAWTSDPELWINRVHPEDRERIRRASRESDERGSSFVEEYRMITRDGRTIWVHDESVPVARDRSGRPTLMQGAMHDVTERKEAELQLAEAEARYRTLVERVPAVAYIWDGSVAPGTAAAPFISPQVEGLLGFTVDAWQADPSLWSRSVHPDDLERVLAAWHESIEAEGPFAAEYRISRSDGAELWIRDEAAPVSHRGGSLYQGVMLDVTERRNSEERSRVAEAAYRRLVEQLPSVVYVNAVDRQVSAIYVSPRYEDLTGYTAEQRMAEPDLWLRMLHPDDRESTLSDDEGDEVGDTFEMEYRLIRADGRVIWVHDQAVLVELPGGERAWQGVLTDITERQEMGARLREAEERYRAIVEQVPSAIYVDEADEGTATLYVSPQIERITGITPDEWIADPNAWLSRIMPHDSDRVASGYANAVRTRQPWSDEYRMQRGDGSTIWVRDEMSFVGSVDGAERVLGVITDITARKRAEETLRESEQRERLAAERLRALDEMKNTFLSAVSHELRSPLTAILGLSLTIERTADMPEADRADLMERLSANARKLDRLLKDLLDIDRLNRGIVDPSLRPADVAALAIDVAAQLESLAGRRLIQEVEPVIVAIDAPKVERIVENLLMNAARHTPADGTVWLCVEPAEDEGVLIRVDDEGPGVPPELREAIFEPFRQVAPASVHNPGTGIGLSLVSRFAALHGGRAWVEERDGGGASFRVYLPRDGQPEPEDERPLRLVEGS